ncbi:regulatory protein [Mycobacteroides abscessus subsp. massiliense]|jgi:DNA-binding CsgD family transcriptional regulator|nr:regulatory protein [Mycobacteroides abscessus subsp. massiliense]
MISELNPDQPFLAVVADHCRALMDRDAVIVKSLAGQYTDPWVHASATEDAGVLLAAVDRATAVAELSAAMAVYVELGADWDAARVRHRLRDLGVRRRHWSHTTRASTGWASLTIAEEKVARLAAGGLTNRQVARELFISAHTVGFHLRQIYRKLEIRSRVDLARIAPPEVCDVLGGERGEG